MPRHTIADAWHMLLRFAHGPRAGEAASVLEDGLDAWFERQLDPSSIAESTAALAAEVYPLAFASPLTLRHGAVSEDKQEALTGERPTPGKGAKRTPVIHDLQGAQLTRQVLSERQLLEVMTDFWLNHFNVSVRKGAVVFVAGDYVERVIRPHALGRFQDLLIGVASHPAMLIYLDNQRSSVKRPGPKGPRGGLNENFARELLELHTVGVHGGYTQRDIVELARVLSGWGVAELDFAYRGAHHDRGEKVVMGRQVSAGGGYEEGVELLEWLAIHPQTAQFVCHKLAQRFVSDEPPADLVNRLAAVWVRSGGDVAEVLRALYRDPAFWAPEHRGNKVKTSLEWLAGALRIAGARQVPPAIARALRRLGQPPLAEPLPTGYPETAQSWSDSAQLAMRWQFAYRLAFGKVPGVSVDLDGVLGDATEPSALSTRVATGVFGGGAQEAAAAMRAHLATISDPEKRRAEALAVAFAAPEFQYQ